MATGPAPTVEALQRQVAALSAYAQRLEGQLEGRPAPEDPLPSPLPAEAGDGGRGRTRHGFDRDDLQRYSRQMLLPDWGPLGALPSHVPGWRVPSKAILYGEWGKANLMKY